MVGKYFRSMLVFVAFVICFAIIFSFVSAFSIQAVSPNYAIERAVNTLINFTINNTDGFNISQITFTLPMEAPYYGSNGTDASNVVFSNTTSFGFTPHTLNWANTTADGIVGNNLTQSFWFNATLRNVGSAFFTNITIDVVHAGGGADTHSSYNYVVNFGFSGFIKNETGGNESNVNISMYKVVQGNGPPTETLLASVLSDTTGSYSFAGVNGTPLLMYKIKMIRYGPDPNCVSLNTTCNATKIGPSLPSFPAMMYYPTTMDMPAFEFMRPPSLNGTTFYLNPAATLRLWASNGTVAQKFGYQVIDQIVGFPTESSAMSSVSTVDVVVPTGRNFTVMFSRFPGFGAGFGFEFSPLCNGGFMNDTLCPSPPISNSTLGTLTAGQILVVNQSMVTGNYRLSGCIDTGGNNNSNVNMTTISLKMVPWPGFVPPTRADRGDINLTTDISYNLTLHSECNATNYNVNALAWYNISVMGAAGGINYLLEMYAKNATSELGNSGGANNLAIFQNITIYNATNPGSYNLTLYKLAGGYYSSGTTLNTSQIRVNVLNSTGGAITNNINVNVKVKNPVFGTMNYIIESVSSGVFYMPVMNNSNWAKVMVFSNDAPPKEITLNLSAVEQNISVVSMGESNGVGMRRINETGGMMAVNSTQLNSSLAMNLRFLRNSGEWGTSCNVLNPDEGCSLSSVEAKRFNPLTAMVAGKVNMEMKMTSTNVTMTFVNFDMFAAKQPPMESIMNDQATTGASSTSQVWQFGSFAPPNTYEYVIISMPYNDSAINDSGDINLSAPTLYDENWKVVWNQSAGDTSTNLTDDFIAYNNSLYRNYLSSGGMTCDTTDTNLNVTPCFVNTTSNMIYMKIPHFSGVGPTIAGTAPAAATAVASSTTSSSSSGGIAATSGWKTYIDEVEMTNKGFITRELKAKERARILIGEDKHYVGVVSLTIKDVLINISSPNSQTYTMQKGEERQFDVDYDRTMDISIKINDILSNRVNLTISYLDANAVAGANNSAITGAATDSDGGGVEDSGENTSSSNWVWLIIVIAVIAILGLGYFLWLKKRG